ncbi:hypothetical protein ABIC28_002640 [Rhodococcus sp. PvR044]|uniref:hypothetical protein n=1 Tax=Rhodococcus sp. PvR044 TaxID=3156402 RepID=UPI003397933D
MRNTITKTIQFTTVAAGIGAAMTLGAGAASALTVTPIPGGTTIELNAAETAALANAHIAGPVLNPLYPNLRSVDNGLSFGDSVQISADRGAAAHRGSGADVYGPLHYPNTVRLYHYE